MALKLTRIDDMVEKCTTFSKFLCVEEKLWDCLDDSSTLTFEQSFSTTLSVS